MGGACPWGSLGVLWLAWLACATPSTTDTEDDIRVIVQLSDLHISVHEAELGYGEIVNDLAVLSLDLVNPLSPDVLLVTGDAVDSKQRNFAGRQYPEEAAAYSRFEAGIDRRTTVVRVLGNHESFDTGGDHRGPRRRLDVRILTRDGRVVPADDEVEDDAECPAALLVGLDASPTVGLRSPANFLGLMSDADVALIREDMGNVERSRSKSRRACGKEEEEPLVVCFGHYPLSIFSEAHRVGPLGALKHAFGGIGSLEHPVADLVARNCNLYVSGHLHSLFGRLHRVHRVHNDVRGGAEPHRLTELESAAWKDDRRFRIMVVDTARSCMAFEDYAFLTPGSPRMLANRTVDVDQRRRSGWMEAFDRRGGRWGITSERGGFSDGTAMALVTWPPDASYALCSKPPDDEDDDDRVRDDVRAVVLVPSQEGHAQGREAERDLRVTAHLVSRASSARSSAEVLGSVPLTLVGGGSSQRRRLYAGNYDEQLTARLADERVYYLHVEVTDVQSTDDGGSTVAVSAQQPVTRDGTPVPIESTPIESITLYVNWSNVAHRVYLVMICVLLGALVSVRAHRSLILYVAWMWLGPLYFARLLSGEAPFLAFPHGVVGFVDGDLVWVPTADTLLVAVLHYVFCLAPMSVWVMAFRRPSRTVAKWAWLAVIAYGNAKIIWSKLATLGGWCVVELGRARVLARARLTD